MDLCAKVLVIAFAAVCAATLTSSLLSSIQIFHRTGLENIHAISQHLPQELDPEAKTLDLCAKVLVIAFAAVLLLCAATSTSSLL